jgi:hypothetical protein
LDGGVLHQKERNCMTNRRVDPHDAWLATFLREVAIDIEKSLPLSEAFETTLYEKLAEYIELHPRKTRK